MAKLVGLPVFGALLLAVPQLFLIGFWIPIVFLGVAIAHLAVVANDSADGGLYTGIVLLVMDIPAGLLALAIGFGRGGPWWAATGFVGLVIVGQIATVFGLWSHHRSTRNETAGAGSVALGA